MEAHNICPLCKSAHVSNVLMRENIPVFQNLLISSYNSAREIVKGDLSIKKCEECEFVFNSTFDSSKVVYGSDYENTQSYSPFFNQYLDDIITDLVEKNGVKNVNVVEVGCGKGVFLKKLVEAGDNFGYGFDPSYIGPEVELGGKLRFEKRLYNEECTNIKADIVVCRHVIEHIPEPLVLLKSIKEALANSPHARVFFETPTVDWIFENKVMFDFFYEHCSYFNNNSLAKAFELAGFEVVEIKHLFNGQYMWLEARPLKDRTETSLTKYHNNREILSNEFAQYEAEWKLKVGNLINEYNEDGKIAIWGAGAKGVTFLNLIDPDCSLIDCVIDLNPNKVGRFIPGTGHEIIGHEDLGIRELSAVIIMNPNYFEENKRVIEQKQLNIACINMEM